MEKAQAVTRDAGDARMAKIDTEDVDVVLDIVGEKVEHDTSNAGRVGNGDPIQLLGASS